MLKELRVQNFALINHAEIVFKKTFVVITGETGAGKSILLDALSLALGEKADTSYVFDKSKKSIIEAVFDLSQLNLQEFFEQNDLDYQQETFIRREITADGKSRAFINDTPVNISVLKSLREFLIDIHSQHQNLIIHSEQFRFNFIDALANCLKERINYSNLFKQYQANKKELESLIQQQYNSQKETEYLQFLFNELEEANIKEGELSAIEEELQQLENAENIIQQLTATTQTLQNAEINVVQLLHQCKNYLNNISKFNSAYNDLAQRLQSVLIEVKDISIEAEKLLSDVQINPERIEQLNDRLNVINKLLKKHNVKTDVELLQIQKEIESKLLQYQNIDDIIIEKQKQLTQQENQLKNLAQQLSSNRHTAKSIIEKECVEILKDLAMPNAQFIIDIKDTEQLNEYGTNDIQFLFSANKGIAPSEVQKVASGGEISRLMLTIKSLMAKKIHLPTIIFDEIDTGVSGAVASKMGDIMKKMSENMQVIAITHLPQIAAKGQQHLYVSKEDKNNITISRITELNDEERVTEIAKMLSNDVPGEAAYQNARELLTR